MSEDEQEGGGSTPNSRDRSSVQIFICDASAEAGRLLTALQSKGYAIVDVPLGLLPSRVLYQTPHLVICDADAREAKGPLTEMLKNADSKIPILLLGHEDGALALDPQLVSLAKDTMTRPVDIEEAISRIARLAGPAAMTPPHRIPRSGRAPILVASARKPYRSDSIAQPLPGRASVLPDDERLRLTAPVPRAANSDGPRAGHEERSSLGSSSIPSSAPPSSDGARLSAETQAVLEEGRKRVIAYPHQTARPSRLPMASHDNGGELRREFTEALLEPLDRGNLDPIEESEESEARAESGTEAPPSRATSAGPALQEQDEVTNPGGRPEGSVPAEIPAEESEAPSAKETPALLEDLSDLLKGTAPGIPVPGTVLADPPSAAHSNESEFDVLLDTVPPPPRHERIDPLMGTSLQPGIVTADEPGFDDKSTEPPSTSPVGRQPALAFELSREGGIWVPAPALEGLARAIRQRLSGALAQQDGTGIRRTIFVDGDISTVTSSLKKESLAHFLHARGDFGTDVLETLSALPQFGRHAGAALIARGLLGQDDLWPILRAHAEWILGHAIRSEELTHWEEQVPARLLEEPSVFGGAAGTEIYVDSVRRVISPQKALSMLGGGERILARGSQESLLGESALSQDEQDTALSIVSQPLAPFLQSRPEILPVLLGLCHLRVLSTGGDVPKEQTPRVFEEENRELDDEAFTARVRTRRALVDEGDYFSILGVPRSATGYEIDRARDELLVEYADERLNARTAHLLEDLSLLRTTVSEAHLVLHDDLRRNRYRAALEALPL